MTTIKTIPQLIREKTGLAQIAVADNDLHSAADILERLTADIRGVAFAIDRDQSTRPEKITAPDGFTRTAARPRIAGISFHCWKAPGIMGRTEWRSEDGRIRLSQVNGAIWLATVDGDLIMDAEGMGGRRFRKFERAALAATAAMAAKDSRK